MSSFCGRARPALAGLLPSAEEKATVLLDDISFLLLREVFLAPYRWAILPERWVLLAVMVLFADEHGAQGVA